MITYSQFVEELEKLMHDGESLKGAPQRDHDPNFRKWRLRLQDIIDQIEKNGYKVNCPVRQRAFGGGQITLGVPAIRDKLFGQELQDTLNELNLIIENFSRFGEPERNTLKNGSIEAGHVPTISEIFTALRAHHGWKTVVTILALLSAVLYFTFEAGRFVERSGFLGTSGHQGRAPEPKSNPSIQTER